MCEKEYCWTHVDLLQNLISEAVSQQVKNNDFIFILLMVSEMLSFCVTFCVC
jgi:hypothetical protein